MLKTVYRCGTLFIYFTTIYYKRVLYYYIAIENRISEYNLMYNV